MAGNPWSLDSAPPPHPGKARHRMWQFVERHLPNFALVLLVWAFGAVLLYPYMVVTVNTGEVGVLWKRFGGGTVMEKDKLYGEGLWIIAPWNILFKYDLRLQNATETYSVISYDGVNLSATINIRFALNRDSVPYMHAVVGPAYLQTLVKPEIGSRTREVMAQYTAEDIYSRKRSEVERKIKESVQGKITNMMTMMDTQSSLTTEQKNVREKLLTSVQLNDTLVQNIELPTTVVNAINRKAEQFYLSQEYVYRVERERRESERKQIEAMGIAEFQKTVSQGISESYLRWRGIEATLQLATSTNSKVVIIGSGKDGVPIILGNVDSAAQASTTPPADTATKTTAASSTQPLEKNDASRLSTPSEKTPVSSASTPSTTPEAKPSAEAKPASEAKPSASAEKSTFPLSFADVKAWLSKAAEPKADAAKQAEKQPSKSSESKPDQAKADSKPDHSKSADKPADKPN